MRAVVAEKATPGTLNWYWSYPGLSTALSWLPGKLYLGVENVSVS